MHFIISIAQTQKRKRGIFIIKSMSYKSFFSFLQLGLQRQHIHANASVVYKSTFYVSFLTR